jgi:threonine dehydrogenase-like Zn-dependent dehydrogenase
MRAAVISDVGKIAVEASDDPTPLMRSLVIRVSACGLCGTGLHILHGEFAPRLRIVPAHEYVDEVVAIGGNVVALAISEKLAADPNLYCFECHYRQVGRNDLCERWQAIGVTRQEVRQSTSLCPQPTAWCCLPTSEPRTPLSSSHCRARSEAMTSSGNSSHLRC